MVNVPRVYHLERLRAEISLEFVCQATVREMSSVLISDMYGQLLSQDDITKAFSGLLGDLPDLTIDAPDAPKVNHHLCGLCYWHKSYELLC